MLTHDWRARRPRAGAVRATLDELRQPTDLQSRNLRSIVDRIRPGVEGLLSGPAGDADELQRRAERANILASVQQLRHGSSIIEGLGAYGGLMVLGAWYSIETGVVEFLDD